MSVRQLERLKVRLSIGIVRIRDNELPCVACSAQLPLDIHPDSISLLLRWDAVLEVYGERRTHPVLHVVDMVHPDFFIEFDIVYRSDVVRFWIVERARRERLHVKYLSRVFDVPLRVERAYLRRLFSLIVPILRVVIVFDLLVFIHEARADILKR